MYLIIKRGIFRVKNVTRDFVIVETELYENDAQCLIHENETRSFFKSSGTSNRTLAEYEIMKCSQKMVEQETCDESLGPFAGMWFPFYGISTSINSEGQEEDWIVKSTKVRDHIAYSKKIERLIKLGPVLSRSSREKFKIMINSYFICYTDLCISAWLGDGLWETEFKDLKDILIRDMEITDLSGEIKEDLTHMNKSELNDYLKQIYSVSMIDDAVDKINALNKPHYESMVKSRAKSTTFLNSYNSTMTDLESIILKRNTSNRKKHVMTDVIKRGMEKEKRRHVLSEVLKKGVEKEKRRHVLSEVLKRGTRKGTEKRSGTGKRKRTKTRQNKQKGKTRKMRK